jgi:hypothetical protein
MLVISFIYAACRKKIVPETGAIAETSGTTSFMLHGSKNCDSAISPGQEFRDSTVAPPETAAFG